MTPIKLSSDLQRQEVIAHLLSLDPEDLRLRFGYRPTEEIITKYVNESWLRSDDRWFGIYHHELDGIVGTLHVADMGNDTAEFGFTVDKRLRGKGYGNVLFSRGSTWAKARGIKHVFMHCLTENAIIQHIAKKNNMNVVRLFGGESEADLTLPTDYTAPINEAIIEQIAIYDMLMVNQQRIISRFLGRTS